MTFLTDLAADGRIALRAFGQQKLLAFMAVVSMSIGIGANTAVFTVANALLFRGPAGVSEPGRLVDVGVGRDDGGLSPASYPSYTAIRERATTFDGVFARQLLLQGVTIDSGTPELRHAEFVTRNYFAVLGLRPAVGRLFLQADSDVVGASPIAVLSHRYWVTRFNRQRDVVGRTMRVNDQPFTVVGVTPDGFQGLGISPPDVWIPITMKPLLTGEDAAIFRSEEAGWLVVGARLKPGETTERASADVRSIGRTLERRDDKERARSLRAVPSSLFAGNVRVPAVFIAFLTGVAAVVLMMACTNVSGILVAKGIVRHKEMALRLSLGATRARLVRQLLAETAVIAFAGAAAGWGLAQAVVRLAGAWLSSLPVPLVVSFDADGRVMTFTLALSIVTCLVAGLVPAWRTSNAHPIAAIKGDEHGPLSGTRLRRVMVIGQVALSMTLVVLAGLFSRALAHAGSVTPGFETRGVELTRIDLPASYTAETGAAFMRELIARIRALPGVDAAALSKVVPGGFEGIGLGIGMPGVSADDFEPDGNVVEPGYFATLGIPIVAGRDFDARDRADSQRVAIVDQEAARRYWPGQNAIGQYLTRNEGPDGPARRYEIVGVVGDVKSTSLIDGVSQSFLYLPFQQAYDGHMLIVTRSNAGRSLASDVRRAIAAMDGTLPVPPATTLTQSVALGHVLQRASQAFAGSLGTFGLCLAAAGLYAVMSLTILRRLQEFGIRLALGARPVQILKLVLRQGLGLVLIGCGVGALPAVGAAYVFAGFLQGLPPFDPFVVGIATLLFVAVGLTACLGPALRATRINPLSLLR